MSLGFHLSCLSVKSAVCCDSCSLLQECFLFRVRNKCVVCTHSWFWNPNSFNCLSWYSLSQTIAKYWAAFGYLSRGIQDFLKWARVALQLPLTQITTTINVHTINYLSHPWIREWLTLLSIQLSHINAVIMIIILKAVKTLLWKPSGGKQNKS